jgi:serine/threonine protein kinase
LKEGWLHRDISDGNVLLYRKPNCNPSKEASDGEWGGLLIDWEYARKREDIGATQKERTGTYAFMSRRLLSGEECHAQDVTDDLESFFWVTLYNCIRYLHTNIDGENLSEFLMDCFRNDWRIGAVKGELAGGETRGRFVRKEGSIGNLEPVRWLHQHPITFWTQDVLRALNTLDVHQTQLTKVAKVLAIDPDLNILDDVELMMRGLTSRTLLLDRYKKLPLSERFLPDCEMAKHSWFLETLNDALSGKRGDLRIPWNNGLEIYGQDGRTTEGASDHWTHKPQAQQNQFEINSHSNSRTTGGSWPVLGLVRPRQGTSSTSADSQTCYEEDEADITPHDAGKPAKKQKI